MSLYLAENDDLIGVYNGGQPVGDEHRRPLFHHLLHRSQDVLQQHKFTSITDNSNSSDDDPDPRSALCTHLKLRALCSSSFIKDRYVLFAFVLLLASLITNFFMF